MAVDLAHATSTTAALDLAAGQLVTSERGICGGPLAFNSVNLVSNIAFWQSLVCARSPYQTTSTANTTPVWEAVLVSGGWSEALVSQPVNITSRCTTPNTVQHSSVHTHVQHSTAQHSTAQHSTAQHSTAQHSTAQHSTAHTTHVQHIAGHHSTAQYGTLQNSMAHKSIAHHVILTICAVSSGSACLKMWRSRQRPPRWYAPLQATTLFSDVPTAQLCAVDIVSTKPPS
jgi:hypothetical protein